MPDKPRKHGIEGTPLGVAVDANDRRTLDMVSQALDQQRLKLAFQPVVSAADTDRVAFHEALIRVMDTTGRVIPAADFMDVVETQELGRRIDVAALEMGLTALARVPTLRLAVNMSARSIGYGPWLRALHRGLKRDVTIAERLILEITESSAMLVPELVASFMDDLQQHGIAFALDDFGAGFTAFRYFKDFFFDMVKIDGQFIRGIDRSRDNQVLTQALASIGRHFEMVVVAESVETVAEAEFLRGIGVDCLQGYLFGAPSTRVDWDKESLRMTG
ncbi:EAL domain-containing protein [Falsirhodobacter algicola]|uniref:EAL domain-containing protein n=1 Tax=Falsirhodobacter algicola TaxID=2692330 RepID=A0A8J8SL07_9RHOB|nr:EAL domain-containing protein [Falsirhodobacter algicola]QUS35894.1 EAL domain-containing protein [Falsirhodobacter algicola]